MAHVLLQTGFGLEFDLLEWVEHQGVIFWADIGEVVVAQLLHLDGWFLLVAGETQRKAEALLLSAEELRLDVLWSKVIVENIIFVDEADELLLVATTSKIMILVLLLDQLLWSGLEIKVIILDQSLFV